MKLTLLKIPNVLAITPDVHRDERGVFAEIFDKKFFEDFCGKQTFRQENCSFSYPNVLRGLHYQVKYPQGKLVSVVAGEILDVVVDIRKGSPNFGEWLSVNLSEDNHMQLWIPEGFAHGFYNIGDKPAKIIYKVTNRYFPYYERTIRWDDETLNINWQLKGDPVISEKDKKGVPFKEADYL